MEFDPLTPSVTPVPDTFRILVVCTANICRSPMAEHLLRADLAQQTNTEVEYDMTSAGIRGWDAAEMDADAAAELRKLGGDPTNFRSKQLTAHDIETAGLILTAAREHRTFVLEQVPRALRRTYTILEFAHLLEHLESKPHPAGDPREIVIAAFAHRGDVTFDHYDIEDPYRASAAKHHEIAAVIAKASKTIAAGLTR